MHLSADDVFFCKNVRKNSDLLLAPDELDYYKFSMEQQVSIDDRIQYVIRFSPKVKVGYALCQGLLYIDQETLSFSKASFGNFDIFYDKVQDYWDADFWKGYNIIEPTESLDKAVIKLKKNNALESGL